MLCRQNEQASMAARDCNIRLHKIAQDTNLASSMLLRYLTEVLAEYLRISVIIAKPGDVGN